MRYVTAARVVAAAALGMFAALAAAQEWPTRPIRLIVPFPPGGAADIVARVISQPLSVELKQTVLVENRPGAGTTIGAKAALTANDSFHTLFVSNSAPIAIAPFLFDKPPYDPVNDFKHISYIGSVPNAFFVAASVPAKNWDELITWIRSSKDGVHFGSGGGGSIGHIVGEMFKQELNLPMEHLAYKGSAPMFVDMLGGQLSFGVNTLTEVWEYAKQGKVRVIALTATQRPKITPDIPLVTELGYPQLVAENFIGISGPANMPAALVEKLDVAMTKVMADPKILTRLEDLGFTVSHMSPAEFQTYVAKQVAAFQPAVKASGAKLN